METSARLLLMTESTDTWRVLVHETSRHQKIPAEPGHACLTRLSWLLT